MKLLLVEDDSKLADHLATSLKEQGFCVSVVSTARDLTEYLNVSVEVDLVVLDRLLGRIDTKVFFARIKSRWPHAPVLVLSAISTPNERIDLINLGADDYLGKPFSTGELIARIRALVRRTAAVNTNYRQVGNLIVDLMKRSVSVGERSEMLPAKEFLLLRALSNESGRIWSRNELLDYVWGQTSDVNTNVVEATVTNIRKKLQDLGSSTTIKNMRNSGYWIEA